MLAAAAASLPLITALPADNAAAPTFVEGFDVSASRPVDFRGAFNAGRQFVMIKATESRNKVDPKVSQFQP